MFKNNIFAIIYSFLGLGCILFFPISVSAREYDYINISNPFLRKTPVAVTDFKVFNGHAAEVVTGETARDILKEALDFTGWRKRNTFMKCNLLNILPVKITVKYLFVPFYC